MKKVYYVRVKIKCFERKNEVIKELEMPSSTLDVVEFSKQWHKIEYIANQIYGCKYDNMPKSKSFKVIRIEKIKEL